MPKYHAFISYSQASSRSLATAVEHNLKRFAKPWYRVRSLSIFRDETDLSATPRLWSVIKTRAFWTNPRFLSLLPIQSPLNRPGLIANCNIG